MAQIHRIRQVAGENDWLAVIAPLTEIVSSLLRYIRRLRDTWFHLQALSSCHISFGPAKPEIRAGGCARHTKDYVPIVHSDRYFSCSSVNLSILTPMDASFKLATCSSIFLGTGRTFLSSFCPCLARYSAHSD